MRRDRGDYSASAPDPEAPGEPSVPPPCMGGLGACALFRREFRQAGTRISARARRRLAHRQCRPAAPSPGATQGTGSGTGQLTVPSLETAQSGGRQRTLASGSGRQGSSMGLHCKMPSESSAQSLGKQATVVGGTGCSSMAGAGSICGSTSTGGFESAGAGSVVTGPPSIGVHSIGWHFTSTGKDSRVTHS